MLALAAIVSLAAASPAIAQDEGAPAPQPESAETTAAAEADAEAQTPSGEPTEAAEDAEPASDESTDPAAEEARDVVLLEAAAARQNLWLLLDGNAEAGEQARVVLKHRGGQDEPDLIREPTLLSGSIVPGGVAAGDDRIWLVYAPSAATQMKRPADSQEANAGAAANNIDASETVGRWLLVQSIRTEWYKPQVRYLYDLEAAPPLPARVDLLSMAAGRRAPWVLLKPQSPQEQTWLASLPASEQAAAENADSDETSSAESDLWLLTLKARNWQSVALPAGLDEASDYRLVMVSSDAALPTIVRRDGSEVRVYRPQPRDADQPLNNVKWNARSYELQAGSDRWEAIGVDGELLIGTLESGGGSAGPLAVSLQVLRSEGALPIGRLSLDVPADSDWKLVSLDRAATLLAGYEKDLHWSRMDLEGNAVGEAGLLKQRDIQPISEVVDYIMIGLTVIVFGLAMLVVMRRDPRAQKVELPAETMIADLSPRAAAMFIDIVPCFGLSLYFFDIDQPMDLLLNWMRDANYEKLYATLLTLGLYTGHTMIAEMFTGRSLGKWLIGLRVVTTAGKPPAMWQYVVRNLTKILELMFALLLVVPVMMPTRQRFGDLLARTLVVTSTPPVQDESQPKADEEEDGVHVDPHNKDQDEKDKDPK